MNGQALPGFYWDSEKKKYFKIQSQNAARGLDLKYSLDNIRKEERKERIQNATNARSNQIRKERVVRRNQNSFAYSHVEREIGTRRQSYYLQNTWPDACTSGISSRPADVISRRPSHAPIRLFDRDPISKTVYIVQGSNSVGKQRLRADEETLQDEPDLNEYTDPRLWNAWDLRPWDEVYRTTSTTSSLCYMPATGALAATSYGSDRPPEIWLTDPGRDDSYVGERYTPKGCSTIWAAAARPTTFSPSPGLANSVAASYAEHLAIAASSAMLLFTRSEAGAWNSKIVVKSLTSDVLALEWISYTTIALGCRDGTIRLYDTRSGGSSHVLSHPYPISKLKRADDETRLICSGLQDTLFLYDIRSPRLSRNSPRRTFNYDNHHYNESYFKTLYPGNRDHSKRRKLNYQAFMSWSQPVLSFAHANRDELDLDIDVHARLGLVAAGQDLSTGTAIRVSNIWTGKTVKEFRNQSEKKDVWEKIRSLKFVERDEGVGGVELWSCWNGGIAKFCC
ncbi:hypothetical protein BDW02DRAFT_206628 [Decorospora gaudefroyi]|uniref:WD40 repeat-like protein n=1 Tax=Decorospora gaudefroyi TaxID=184978 RepID=A0A6A5JXH8_9PLEO|nr:hypothetical protein BDW02DRAFT_206628 [Decorospora gaudefroyi]